MGVWSAMVYCDYVVETYVICEIKVNDTRLLVSQSHGFINKHVIWNFQLNATFRIVGYFM